MGFLRFFGSEKPAELVGRGCYDLLFGFSRHMDLLAISESLYAISIWVCLTNLADLASK